MRRRLFATVDAGSEVWRVRYIYDVEPFDDCPQFQRRFKQTQGDPHQAQARACANAVAYLIHTGELQPGDHLVLQSDDAAVLNGLDPVLRADTPYSPSMIFIISKCNELGCTYSVRRPEATDAA